MHASFAEHVATLQQRYEETLCLLGEGGIPIEAVLLPWLTPEIFSPRVFCF